MIAVVVVVKALAATWLAGSVTSVGLEGLVEVPPVLLRLLLTRTEAPVVTEIGIPSLMLLMLLLIPPIPLQPHLLLLTRTVAPAIGILCPMPLMLLMPLALVVVEAAAAEADLVED